MTTVDLIAAAVIAVGLVGILVPILPGTMLVVAGIFGWALVVGGPTAWSLALVAGAVLAIGTIVKYVVPGRHLEVVGIPARTQWCGVLLGVIGFFVVPVIGLFLGFVLGVYLAEVLRVGAARAWPSTVHSLKAVGMSIVIELGAAVAATCIWVAGVVVT